MSDTIQPMSSDGQSAALVRPHRKTTGLAILENFGCSLVIGMATCAAFWPVLSNSFVNWGDRADLVSNPHFRGLSYQNLVWMFSTIQMGHYQPLSWITFAIDYSLWGMNPHGYHLTSMVLHIACSIAVFFLIAEMLTVGRTSIAGQDRMFIRIAALTGALVFAVHPLRVETVAWATERRGALFALFLVLSVLCYVRYARNCRLDPMVPWSGVFRALDRRYWSSVVFFALSLLAKEYGLTLPVILLVLDAYPLRRLTWSPNNFPRMRRQLILLGTEKTPYFILMAAWMGLAILSSRQSGGAKSIMEHSVLQRVAQCCYGLRLYVEKTLWPANLSPLYPIPPHMDPWDARYGISAAIVIALALVVIATARRVPAIAVAGIASLITVAPVLGFVQTGPQIAADRYTYLPAIAFSTALAAVLVRFWAGDTRRHIRLMTSALVACALVAALGTATSKQCRMWRDSETLWSHALAVEPSNITALNNLGETLIDQNRLEEAASLYRRSLNLDPDNVDAHNNVGVIYAQQGQLDDAISQFQAVLKIQPRNAQATENLRLAGQLQRRPPTQAGSRPSIEPREHAIDSAHP